MFGGGSKAALHTFYSVFYWMHEQRDICACLFVESTVIVPVKCPKQTPPKTFRDNGTWMEPPELDVRSTATQTLKLQEEQIVREWLNAHGYFMAKSSVVQKTFFHHFAACLPRLAGRFDQAGSQQAAFSMELPALEPLEEILQSCEYHDREKYVIKDGQIAWAPSSSISTYYISDEQQVAEFLKLHERQLGAGVPIRPLRKATTHAQQESSLHPRTCLGVCEHEGGASDEDKRLLRREVRYVHYSHVLQTDEIAEIFRDVSEISK
eukprot:835199-Pleurochrysis_carterae.AAC.1